MIIDCISDLHGYYPELEGGDLLIICGDLTARDTPKEYFEFEEWLETQPYKKKVLIAGNHDNFLIKNGPHMFANSDYLIDSGTEHYHYYTDERGLSTGTCYRIWGSPWTKTFPGMNPVCKAFTVDTEEELADKWSTFPNDIDILITHSPIYGVLDRTTKGEHVGSKSLSDTTIMRWDAGLKLHVCGHVHEGYGEKKEINTIFETHHVNASHVNERYQPVNKPIRVNL